MAINRRRIVDDLTDVVCCSKNTNILRTSDEKLTVHVMNPARVTRYGKAAQQNSVGASARILGQTIWSRLINRN